MAIHLKPENPILKELATIARRSYEIGLTTIRPGVTFQEVYEAMLGPIVEAGCWHMTPLIHSMNPQGWTSTRNFGIEQSHGIDEKYKTMKVIPMVKGNLVIKPNTIFEIEPNACRSKHRVNIGGTVIVTKDGAEELNKLPNQMWVV